MNTRKFAHKMRSTYFNFTLLVIISFCILQIISCKKQDVSHDTVKNVIVNKEKDTQLSITDAYIIPDPIDDILLNTIPQTVSDRNDTKKIVQKIKKLIDPKIELYKYLQRKREYAKTSIFDDIP